MSTQSEYVQKRLASALAITRAPTPRRTRRPFTSDEVDVMVRLARSGVTYAAIAERFDRSRMVVYVKLRKVLGKAPRVPTPRASAPASWDKAALHDIDWSQCPMAQKYGAP